MIPQLSISHSINYCENLLKQSGREIHTDRWQGIDITGNPQMRMVEVLDVDIKAPIPPYVELTELIKPNLPWADVHFEERVGGFPLNPGESYKSWPFYKLDSKVKTQENKFSHTYMERFWPKFAGNTDFTPRQGIRYEYGDLYDMVNHLKDEPYSRQAYLPIWFPEDTGVVHKGRVPCSLGYLFIMRDGYLHMKYYIRSCDFIRHFRDDIYLACLLLYWVLGELQKTSSVLSPWQDVQPGYLRMSIDNLHVFKGDLKLLQ